MNLIRWTDKLFLDNDGNIRDFNNNKLGYKVINRGKCMLCGKELTEGLFFCKECEKKGKGMEE